MKNEIQKLLVEDIIKEDSAAFSVMLCDYQKRRLRWHFAVFFVVLFAFFAQYFYLSIKINHHLSYFAILCVLLLSYILFSFIYNHLKFEKYFSFQCKKLHLKNVVNTIIYGDFDEILKIKAFEIKKDLDNGLVDEEYLKKLLLDGFHLESFIEDKY